MTNMYNNIVIKKIESSDFRVPLKGGAGSDAIHTDPTYAYAVCNIVTDTPLNGTGLAFTLGAGNELVCQAIEFLGKKLEGREIHELMSDYGKVFKSLADDANYRWLGPHKGIVHLALASITNACFDLWAKAKGVPIWKLLIELSPEEIVNTADFSGLEEVLTPQEAIELLKNQAAGKEARMKILENGYQGYDTSVGWFHYGDEKVAENVKKALDSGFTAMKLKVGSADPARDIRRAELIRKLAGDQTTIMLDANQQWSFPKALDICKNLQAINPYWIEEPLHPDDILAHVELAKAIAPTKIAAGEHVPNKIMFKNYLMSGSMHFNQVDAVRVGGVSEFIAISLLSKKYGVPVVPHVGDMGQIHQHLVLFNHISIGHEALFLEYIPHLRDHFKYPAQVINGHYQVPQEPGMSSDLIF